MYENLPANKVKFHPGSKFEVRICQVSPLQLGIFKLPATQLANNYNNCGRSPNCCSAWGPRAGPVTRATNQGWFHNHVLGIRETDRVLCQTWLMSAPISQQLSLSRFLVGTTVPILPYTPQRKISVRFLLVQDSEQASITVEVLWKFCWKFVHNTACNSTCSF